MNYTGFIQITYKELVTNLHEMALLFQLLLEYLTSFPDYGPKCWIIRDRLRWGLKEGFGFRVYT